VLRACRKVLREGGRLAFYVISIASGGSERDVRTAREAGPPFVDVEQIWPGLFGRAGLPDAETIDVTEQYRSTAARWLSVTIEMAVELRSLLGDEAFEEYVTSRTQKLEAIDRGLLKRSLFLAHNDR
jgi:tripartite-type tricarboxylate transporter receptor subunit TctC